MFEYLPTEYEKTTRSNTGCAHCAHCGCDLAPGAGSLDFLLDADDDDDFARIGTAFGHAHWVASCIDRAACEAQVAIRAAKVATDRAASRDAAKQLAAQRAAENSAKQAAWLDATAGLERSLARPDGLIFTGEYFDSGRPHTCRQIALTGGAIGWQVDTGGAYSHWLLPPAARAAAEAEKTRLERIYKWWRPGVFHAQDYPGPGVPEDQLTADERAEVARCQAARHAAEHD